MENHVVSLTIASDLQKAVRDGRPLTLEPHTVLNFSFKKLGDEGVKYLSQALRGNSSLTQLDVSATFMGAEGVKYLSEALKYNSILTQLEMGRNNVGAEGAKYVSESLKCNSTLMLLSMGWCGLGLEGSTYLCEALRCNSTLTHLNLCENGLRVEGVGQLSIALQYNSSLTLLDIGGNNIGPEGMRYLSEFLKHNSILMRLNLCRNALGAEGTKYLSEALAQNSALTVLNVANNRLGAEGMKYLREALKLNTTLAHLNLRANRLEVEAAKYLSDALMHNSTLTQLNLEYNRIGSAGVKHIADGLIHNSALAALEMRCNVLGIEGAGFISEALKNNSTLTLLDITDNSLGAEGTKFLSEALKYNSSLTQLSMESCDVGAEGVKYMSEALKYNSTLTRLHMRDYNLGDEVAKYIIEALRYNFVLTQHTLLNDSVATIYINCYLTRNNELVKMKLTDELATLLNDETPDVTIHCEDGGVMRAHRIVLAARSSFFRRCLNSSTTSDRNHGAGGNSTIKLEGVSYRFMQTIVQYLYCDVLSFTTSHLTSDEKHAFLSCAEKLVPEHLSRIRRLLVAHQLKQLPTDDIASNMSAIPSKEMLWAVNNPLYHDVVFVVGGDENNKRFFAHKVVLCGRSAYFRAMLTGGMRESHEKEIQLHKVNPEAFSIVLEYLYTKNLNVVGHEMSNEQIIETFSLATEYGVEPLRFKLETMLELRIDVENVCSLLVFSDIHRAVKLKHACCKFFIENRKRVLDSGQIDYYMQFSTLIDKLVEEYSSQSLRLHNPKLHHPHDINRSQSSLDDHRGVNKNEGCKLL